MNWLRRLIPWAFKHDMDFSEGSTRWDRGNATVHFRLVCKRCGFLSDEYQVMDHAMFSRSFAKRGCRGAS